MSRQIHDVLNRSHDTIWKDAIGAVSLMVILVAGLHLPSFF
ncbi:hypothetical protein [Rhodalgimonas zhirmunskyi]|nr:hypothetical protein [Rhodoalgimonas zhirmunskyi]